METGLDDHDYDHSTLWFSDCSDCHGRSLFEQHFLQSIFPKFLGTSRAKNAYLSYGDIFAPSLLVLLVLTIEIRPSTENLYYKGRSRRYATWV